MPAFHDLECRDCGHIERDEIVQDWKNPQPCVKCAGSTFISYKLPRSTDSLKADNFTPVDVNGRHLGTRDEWFAYRKELADQQGCDPSEIQMRDNNRHERNARVDDAKHMDWLKRNRPDEIRRIKEEAIRSELLPHFENALRRYS